VFGEQDKLLNVFAKLQKLAPLMPLAGADCRFQPVWVQDVAQAMVSILTLPQPKDVYEAFGKDILTLRELVNLAGRCAGVQRPVLPLPGFAAQMQAWVMEHLPGEPLMSRDNLKSLLVDNVASGKHPGLDALAITPASIYAIAPLYLGSIP
jgi:NADH dehydrogenase